MKINKGAPKSNTCILHQAPVKTYKLTVDGNGTQKIYNEKKQLHFEGGPAIIYKDGYKEYYKNNKLHNESGPAILNPKAEDENEREEYYIKGKQLTKQQFDNRKLYI